MSRQYQVLPRLHRNVYLGRGDRNFSYFGRFNLGKFIISQRPIDTDDDVRTKAVPLIIIISPPTELSAAITIVVENERFLFENSRNYAPSFLACTAESEDPRHL